MNRPSADPTCLISVIIVNYNGARWMERCLQSLAGQTIAPQIEIVIADNQSTDGSDAFAARWLQETGLGRLVQNGRNAGFCEGNNIGARLARGRYLLFLNFDLWLEKDCLEQLIRGVEQHRADAGSPIVRNYQDDTFQSSGSAGLDIFGLPNPSQDLTATTAVFAAPGCSLLVSRVMFDLIGGFPNELFMFAEETDIGWRIWLAGGSIVIVPSARVHHEGGVTTSKQGEGEEFRTTESKRYYANRNGLLLLLKNAEHLMLILVVNQLALLLVEAMVSLVLLRQWSYIRKSYWAAVRDCWRMRHVVYEGRARVRSFRRRGDFWMLRHFLKGRLNRWPDLQRLFKFGLPKVDAR